MRLTTLNDKQIAAAVGRGLWTVFHIRKAAGIPATNKGRAAFVVGGASYRPQRPTEIREYWLSADPTLRSA